MSMGCMYCSISGRNLFLDAYNTLEVRPVNQRQYLVPDSPLGMVCGGILLGMNEPNSNILPGCAYKAYLLLNEMCLQIYSL